MRGRATRLMLARGQPSAAFIRTARERRDRERELEAADIAALHKRQEQTAKFYELERRREQKIRERDEAGGGSQGGEGGGDGDRDRGFARARGCVRAREQESKRGEGREGGKRGMSKRERRADPFAQTDTAPMPPHRTDPATDPASQPEEDRLDNGGGHLQQPKTGAPGAAAGDAALL